jgi:histone deacetylase 1/2
VGVGKGKYYAVNVPLLYGIDDESYHQVFQPVMRRVMEWYRPSSVVLQLGADSLAGDRLGMFNLSMRGHARCVEFMKTFGVPILMVGGGGYTIRNVARTWTFETAKAIGVELSPHLPHNDFLEYYGPEYILDVPASNIPNNNNNDHLARLVEIITEHLRSLPFAPSVQIQDTPPGITSERNEDLDDPDERFSRTFLGPIVYLRVNINPIAMIS